MQKKHKKTSPRIEIGEPFERLIIHPLLDKTNTGNLSHNWNTTDMARFALAMMWTRTGAPLPRECEELLPRFWRDLDV